MTERGIMTEKEVREALERMEVATARGRAKANKREVHIEPQKHEVEYATRKRADGYLETARNISDMVQSNRHGIKEQELERVELIREMLIVLAQNTYVELVDKG